VARVRAEGETLALAWADISTGEFHVVETTADELAGMLARLEPGETLVSDSLYDAPELKELWRGRPGAVTPLPGAGFDSTAAMRRLCDYFAVAALDGFGGLGRAECAACGAIVSYIERTQRSSRPPLAFPKRETAGAVMSIDPATRTSLELLSTSPDHAKAACLQRLIER
jgi:DNA mismatch repair protein MutS